jgi:hypothetical protein
MPTFKEKEIEDLKAKHAGVTLHLLRSDRHDVEIIVRAPSEPEWTRFRAMQENDGQAPMANKTLVVSCLVAPSAEETRAIFAELPGIPEVFANQIAKIAGIDRAATSRKL